MVQEKIGGVWLYFKGYKSLTMKEEVPSYVIKYIECSQEGHKGEKVNLICLNTQCHENSLICSLCTPKHRGHEYKPIKIYLDELYRNYQIKKGSQERDLQELQKRKLLLLHNLRVCVEKISQEFMKLEEDILFTYQKIKNQIHENEARKSKFKEFYLSMVKDNYGDPHFQVKNYLFKEEIKILTDQDIFEDLTKTMEKQVKNVRQLFISENKKVEQKKKQVEQKTDYLVPASIVQEGDTFIQANQSPNMSLFNLDINQWVSKLRLEVMTKDPAAKLTVGLIRMEEFNKANFVFKDTIPCMYVDSAGQSKSVQHNHIGVFQVNSVLDFFVKKNNFRIVCKNSNVIMNLADKNYFFFFAMEGSIKIKITYPIK